MKQAHLFDAQAGGLTANCRRALDAVPALSAALRAMGLGLRTSVIRAGNGRTEVLHVMVERDGQRLLDWWPSSGRFRTPDGDTTGALDDPAGLPALVAEVLATRDLARG